MTRRAAAAFVTVAATALVAGCTSGSAPSARPDVPVRAGITADPGGTRLPSAAVADMMQRALAAPRSARIAIASTVTGEKLTGGGVLALHAGTVTAADVTDELPAKLGTIRLLRAGGTDYAKLPAALAPKGKPWVVLDPHSGNVITSQIAGIATPLLQVASPATLVALVRSSPSVRDQGPTPAGTRRYAVTVDPAHLPPGVPTSIAGGSGGTRTLQLELDGADRPVRVAGTLTVSGLAVDAAVTLSGYGAPVSIAAPPAGAISR